MRFRFKCRDEQMDLDYLREVVAVRPSRELRALEAPSAILKRLQTARAADDARGPFPLPARNRKVFEKAGWLFARARPALADAAFTRTRAHEDAAVRPVFVDRGGNTLIGTEFVTVQLSPDMTAEQAAARLEADGLELIRKLNFGRNLFEAGLPPGQPLIEAVPELQSRPWYVFVEPVFVQILGGRAGGDPDLDKQWHHATIRTPNAWIRTRGAGVRIAIIDNGMQVDHPDLAEGIVSGGYFVDRPNDTAEFHRYEPGVFFPNDTHGTFVMGMAGARRNNDVHGCGAAPESHLIAIACALDQVTTQVTLARAVAFAADPTTEDSGLPREAGADVLACSLGPERGDWQICSVLERAITHAAATGRNGLGLPIFWAVANRGGSINQDQVCSHLDVIAVGKSGPSDFEEGSASGPKLEFLAPGERVFSTASGGKFGRDSGASYACPLAAGTAALVLSEWPHWDRFMVRDRLRATCDQIGGVVYGPDHRHDDYGFGRINADRAINDP
jgi:hypothetical protein